MDKSFVLSIIILTLPVGSSIEVTEHDAKLFQRFCYDHDVVSKSKVSYVLAIDLDAEFFLVQ